MVAQEIPAYFICKAQAFFTKLSSWTDSSNFVYPIFLSLMSALIFWVIFSYYPERKRQVKIRPIVELELFNIYQVLFSVFDLIMRHSTNSPSDYQSDIRSGLLSRNNIKLGIQNKCLNSSYLYDENINSNLIIVGEELYERSVQIDYLIDKIISFSQYATAEEILLLEEIRVELRRYDFGEKNIKKSAGDSMAGKIYLPIIPIIYYREKNFSDLYDLFVRLQVFVLSKNSYLNRSVFLYNIQNLFYSREYTRCKKFIDAHKLEFKTDENFYTGYYALSEYNLGNMNEYYQIVEQIYKARPFNGSLVSSRSFLKDFVTDKKVIEILSRYHSEEEVNHLKDTVKSDSERKNNFIKENKALSEYFAQKDTRLTPVRSA